MAFSVVGQLLKLGVPFIALQHNFCGELYGIFAPFTSTISIIQGTFQLLERILLARSSVRRHIQSVTMLIGRPDMTLTVLQKKTRLLGTNTIERNKHIYLPPTFLPLQPDLNIISKVGVITFSMQHSCKRKLRQITLV